ncbi:DeoR/GlpR family transcriptional regulator [Streptomyces formicae]|uniref:DeoR/GlpR family transcriptional regulator n=2 Tax=Streptomyces formicae TaxID=1616117 RepID=A0ABY3WFY8_9ACTN|nr:substrate-binding domain-containing protein [Streptomyces formicae]UNM10312.1 DeoR/GlpR family transcriptional regulator [Streptomyces formicae]
MLFSQRRETIMRTVRLHGAVRVAEIAERLHVSQMTVRRDINLLAEEGLVVRVHGGATLPARKGAATEQRPTPDGLGGKLVLGMVVPAATRYHRQVVQGAREAAEALGARLSLGVSRYDLHEDRVQADRLVESGIDGLLLTPSAHLGEAAGSLSWISRLPVPVTIVERRRDPRVGLDTSDYVASDHELGALSAVRHLHDLGHRRIALVCNKTPSSSWIVRGLDAATELLGLPRDVPRVLVSADSDQITVDARLDEAVAAGASAVLAHPDYNAITLVETVTERGMAIPGDLAIIAYDDTLAAHADIPLTAVEPPRSDVGRTAVGLLVRRLNEGPAHPSQQTLLAPRVNVRASTAPWTSNA